MKKEQGFSAIEALIATTIAVILMAGALSSFNDSATINESATQMLDLEQNIRAGMNFVATDFVSAGWSIPSGGIPIPSGDGVTRPTRPGPPGTVYTFNSQTIAAVTPGPRLGLKWNGKDTDIVNILYADDSENSFPLNDHTLSNITFGGDIVTVSDQTPMDKMDHPIVVGDLIALTNAKGSTLQYVTGVAGQTISFAVGDPMNLNQPDAPAGSITKIRNDDGTYPPTTAKRVWLVTYYIDSLEDPETPRLIRRINDRPGRTVALVLEDFQLSYDLVDGVNNPANIKEPVDPNTPSQIRKANILLSGRSASVMRKTGEFLRRGLTTQVSLRSLSYIDRYR
jgi:hypothetical protein